MSLLGVDSRELDRTFLLERVRVLGLSTATGVPSIARFPRGVFGPFELGLSTTTGVPSVARFPVGVFGPFELGLSTTTGVPSVARFPTGVFGPFFILFGDGVVAGDLAACDLANLETGDLAAGDLVTFCGVGLSTLSVVVLLSAFAFCFTI